MEGRRGQFQFHTFSSKYVYRSHLIMDCRQTLPNLANHRRRSQKLYSRNLSMHSTHGHNGVFSRSIYSVLPNDFFAQIGGQYVLCIPTVLLVSKTLRYGSLVVILSNFVRRH